MVIPVNFLLPDFFYFLLLGISAIYHRPQSVANSIRCYPQSQCWQRVGVLLFATHGRYGISKYCMFGEIAIRRYLHSGCRSPSYKWQFLQTLCCQGAQSCDLCSRVSQWSIVSPLTWGPPSNCWHYSTKFMHCQHRVFEMAHCKLCNMHNRNYCISFFAQKTPDFFLHNFFLLFLP